MPLLPYQKQEAKPSIILEGLKKKNKSFIFTMHILSESADDR